MTGAEVEYDLLFPVSEGGEMVSAVIIEIYQL